MIQQKNEKQKKIEIQQKFGAQQEIEEHSCKMKHGAWNGLLFAGGPCAAASSALLR